MVGVTLGVGFARLPIPWQGEQGREPLNHSLGARYRRIARGATDMGHGASNRSADPVWPVCRTLLL